jgi:hypothetical protein
MSNQNNVILKDCVVVGAGISGIAIGRWLKVIIDVYNSIYRDKTKFFH